MSNHTPGPWNLTAGRCFETASGKFFLSYHSNKRTGLPDFPNFCELDANARLIAAAPELLAALESLSECGTQDHDEDYSRCCSPGEPLGCSLCSARAAIARAKGGA